MHYNMEINNENIHMEQLIKNCGQHAFAMNTKFAEKLAQPHKEIVKIIPLDIKLCLLQKN